MVTENTPYRNKKYIVEDLEFDPKFKTEKEIEDLKFKRDQAIGVWSVEASTEDERVSKLFDLFGCFEFWIKTNVFNNVKLIH